MQLKRPATTELLATSSAKIAVTILLLLLLLQLFATVSHADIKTNRNGAPSDASGTKSGASSDASGAKSGAPSDASGAKSGAPSDASGAKSGAPSDASGAKSGAPSDASGAKSGAPSDASGAKSGAPSDASGAKSGAPSDASGAKSGAPSDASGAKSGARPSGSKAEEALPAQWRACRLMRRSGRRPLKLDCRKSGLDKVPSDPPAGVSVVLLGGNVFRDLRSVQLPGIVRLDLSGCAIADIQQYALTGARSLEHLDLTGNELRSLNPDSLRPLAGLQDLVLAQNRLTGIPSLPCDQLGRLHSLNLAANDITSARLPDEFGQCQSLHTLILSGNRRLTELLSGDFNALKGRSGLQVLKMAACPLKRFDADSLIPLKDSLRHLDLSGIQVTIEPLLEGLSQLKDLRWLRLHRVTLERLRLADLARGLSRLHSLQVTCVNAVSRPLSLTDRATFGQGTKFLEHLQLDDCGLNSFDYQVTGLSNLHTLELSRNRLTTIPLGLPAQLTQLFLSGNRIQLVPEGSFLSLTHLTRLDLSRNYLTSVSGAFNFACRAPSLTELVLDLAELEVMKRRGRFNAPPPDIPAGSSMGKKRKKALLEYTSTLLDSMRASCASDPLPVLQPAPPDPPAGAEEPQSLRDAQRLDDSTALASLGDAGGGGRMSAVGIVLIIVGIVAPAVAVIVGCKYRRRFRCYRSLRGTNSASAAAAVAASNRSRQAANSRDTLVTNNHSNRTYEHIGGSFEMRSVLQQQQLQQQQQPEVPGSNPNDERVQSPMSRSESQESFEEDEMAEAEALRLPRAEGGIRRSASLCSIRRMALLIGLSAELYFTDKLNEDYDNIASNFIFVNEATCQTLPDLSSVQTVFVMLSEHLLDNSELLNLLRTLLKDSGVKEKTKIICNIENDTPEFGGRLSSACPILHRIYLKYRIRLIPWKTSERSLRALAMCI